MKQIQYMIDQRGGFEAVRDHYIRLENPPLMRLVIEVIGGPYPNRAYKLSVAHHGEQNGDAMRDPEFTFLVAPVERGFTWTPLTYENSYLGCYQVAAEVNERGEVTVRDQRLLRDLRHFAKQWDLNIKDQGFLEVFERQNAKPNPIAQ
jgi:hypothetical protein